MSSNFPVGAQPLTLRTALHSWIARNPGWSSTYDLSRWPPCRQNTVEQVAEAVVQDPALNQALRTLASPAGQAIEQEVLSLWLPEPDARLLAHALTVAWKAIVDQTRSTRQRATILVGVVLGTALLVLLALAHNSNR